MRLVLSIIFAVSSLVALAQKPSYDDLFTAVRYGWDIPKEAEFKLHFLAFGRSITKNDIDFDKLRDNGLEIQFVYAPEGDLWKLRGFFYKLPAGRHGLKRFFYQTYVPVAVKSDDKRLEPASLYIGKPGKEKLDLSWFRSDLTAGQQQDVRAGNFDVAMFGNYRASVVMTLKQWIPRPKEVAPYFISLVWPDGRYYQDGKLVIEERKAHFLITVTSR